MNPEILSRLLEMEKKLDELAKSVEELRAANLTRARVRKKKEKLPPPTADEILAHRNHFASLFERWMDGRELEVHAELDRLDPDQLRRFADANNLNVTAKMSKERILGLVAGRFREKRQLHRSSADRK
jgi:hypothetical protein